VRRRLVERWRSSTRFQDVAAAAGTFAAGVVFNLVGLTGVWPSPDIDRLAAMPEWWHSVLLAAGCLVMLGKRRQPRSAPTRPCNEEVNVHNARRQTMYLYANERQCVDFPLLGPEAAEEVQVVGVLIKTGRKLAGLSNLGALP
jgi:hypothetical protein